jgi:hypothetical protein
MKDGDERRIECELVLTYCKPDLSVGINGGFAVSGIELHGKFYELEERCLDEKGRIRWCLDAAGTAALNKEAEDTDE